MLGSRSTDKSRPRRFVSPTRVVRATLPTHRASKWMRLCGRESDRSSVASFKSSRARQFSHGSIGLLVATFRLVQVQDKESSENARHRYNYDSNCYESGSGVT